jgi:hypothetical protein
MRPNPIAALVAADLVAREPAPPRRKRRLTPRKKVVTTPPLRVRGSDPLTAPRA